MEIGSESDMEGQRMVNNTEKQFAEADIQYMKVAAELAALGEGGVNPNPLVGAVIVRDGRIIGKGYHARYGQLHAERQAIADAEKNLGGSGPGFLRGSSMYVTLEPCCHQGKTPPCTDAILEAGIERVVIGLRDPNTVAAGGKELLEAAGVETECGLLEGELKKQNEVFLKYVQTKKPFVAMKYAMSADGKIACNGGTSKWITEEAARKDVQKLRNRYMGIMVGIGTVLSDDPRLTCRMPEGRNPVRIVCDSSLRITTDCNLVKSAKDIPLYIMCLYPEAGKTGEGAKKYKEKAEGLKKAGCRLIYCNSNADGRVDLCEGLFKLGKEGIDGILLEGGSTLNFAMLKAGLVDRIYAYVAPKILGGAGAPTAVGGNGWPTPDEGKKLKIEEVVQIGEDLRIQFSFREIS